MIPRGHHGPKLRAPGVKSSHAGGRDSMTSITASSAWRALQAHAEDLRGRHLRELFSSDSERFQRFSLRLDDLLLDYSKNRITEQTMKLLLDLARLADVEGWREKMFAGEKI